MLYFMSVSFRHRYFDSAQGLDDLLKMLVEPFSLTGKHIFVGGLTKLITNSRENWRKIVDNYVEDVANFAAILRTPTVVIQVPWRNESSGLFRLQKDQVR
jgi:hypothetical protein